MEKFPYSRFWTFILLLLFGGFIAIAIKFTYLVTEQSLNYDAAKALKESIKPGQLFYFSLISGITITFELKDSLILANSKLKNWDLIFLLIPLTVYMIWSPQINNNTTVDHKYTIWYYIFQITISIFSIASAIVVKVVTYNIERRNYKLLNNIKDKLN